MRFIMNIKLITMLNVMPEVKPTSADALPFEQVNELSTKYGWIIHPNCCSKEALEWVKKEAAVNYNKTFYKEWSDITSKTRFELLMDQLRHYVSTYGTGFLGDTYIPNQQTGFEIPFKSFKIIMPATDKEIYDRCVKIIQSGIAMGEESLKAVIDFIGENKRYLTYGLDLMTVKNKEAAVRIMDVTGELGTDPFMLLRYLVYKSTGSTLLIKSKDCIQQIKQANAHDLTVLTKEQRVALSSIFYRFKPLFCAFKHMGTVSTGYVFKNEALKKSFADKYMKGNAAVINEIRKLATMNHKPFRAGFWETVLSEKKDLAEIATRLANNEITNFKKVTLMQTCLDRIQKASGKLYVIRNGKMWVDVSAKAPGRKLTQYYMSVYSALEKSLVDSVKGKACKVRYPKNVNLTIPSSEKNFIGNYPFGTSVNMGDSHNIVGIYWRNEWGTRDFDLHMVDLEGRTYGWNSNYYNTDNTIVFSGDMTDAEPEATELFYIDRACPDGKISVSQYSGNPKSQFKLFVACEDMDTSKLYNAMCNPNSVVAEFMIPVENAANKQCAIIVDNRIYLMDLSAGAGRIPNHKYSSVYVDKLKNKCRTFIDLKPILELAGFTEVTDENEEVDLDLSQISKDTLIGLFGDSVK